MTLSAVRSAAQPYEDLARAKEIAELERASAIAIAKYTARMEKALTHQRQLWDRWSVAMCTGCAAAASSMKSVSTSPVSILSGSTTVADDAKRRSAERIQLVAKVGYGKGVRKIASSRHVRSVAARRLRHAELLKRQRFKKHAQRSRRYSRPKAQFITQNAQLQRSLSSSSSEQGVPSTSLPPYASGSLGSSAMISPGIPLLPRHGDRAPVAIPVDAGSRVRIRDFSNSDTF
jgi:hypothetical protein